MPFEQLGLGKLISAFAQILSVSYKGLSNFLMQWSIAFCKFYIVDNFSYTPVYIKYDTFSLSILKAFTPQAAILLG